MDNFAFFKMKLKYSKLGFENSWKHLFGLGNISSISKGTSPQRKIVFLSFFQIGHLSKLCFQVKIRTFFEVDIPNMLLPSPLAYSPKQDSIFIQQKPFTVSSFLQNTLAIMAESQKTKFVAQVDSILGSI